MTNEEKVDVYLDVYSLLEKLKGVSFLFIALSQEENGSSETFVKAKADDTTELMNIIMSPTYIGLSEQMGLNYEDAIINSAAHILVKKPKSEIHQIFTKIINLNDKITL